MPSDSIRSVDRPANLDAGLLLARIMLSALFFVSGYGKLMAVERTTGYFASLGMPMPGVMVWVAILAELGLPVLLLLGIRARWVALALCLFTLITAATGHRFWGFDTATQLPQYTAQLTQFLKNLGIAGGFLLLATGRAGALRGRPARLRPCKAGEEVLLPGPHLYFCGLARAARPVPTHEEQRWGLGRKCLFLPNLALRLSPAAPPPPPP